MHISSGTDLNVTNFRKKRFSPPLNFLTVYTGNCDNMEVSKMLHYLTIKTVKLNNQLWEVSCHLTLFDHITITENNQLWKVYIHASPL